jgi:aerobic carbon-monoxide dehydrogenase medium subunit
VKPVAFAYAKARSLDHAIALLGEHESARVLAGGQSLMATLNMRLDAPGLLVDINHIRGLDRISLRDGAIEIGALVRQSDAERSALIAQHAPLIARALPHIGHRAIRNRGTLAGSIAFADPAAELPACLLALGGEVDIAGPDGTRSVKADDFFKDLFETALGPRDLLTAIRLPAATPAMRVGFAEFCRRHGDYAMAGLAATAQADGAGLGHVRLAYFGVGSTPVRARRAEAALAGGAIYEARLAAAVAALAGDLDPPDDIQGTGAVKRHLAGVLLRRVSAQLAEPR